MILKALYDYYNRCGNLPAPGMEEKEIGFVIVISKEGKFLRFEDCRTDKTIGRVYLVKKHVSRSSAAVANYLNCLNNRQLYCLKEVSNSENLQIRDAFQPLVRQQQ